MTDVGSDDDVAADDGEAEPRLLTSAAPYTTSYALTPGVDIPIQVAVD
jgi:hypothetical protein